MRGPELCSSRNGILLYDIIHVLCEINEADRRSLVVRLIQKYDRLEYRGDWQAQFHKAEIVGAPGHGVPVALFEAHSGDVA